MKKLITWIIFGIILVAFVAIIVTPYLRNEYINTHTAVVYRKMNKIADGVQKYQRMGLSRLTKARDLHSRKLQSSLQNIR